MHFLEEAEVDLNDLTTNATPKAPYDSTLRTHWLSIDGIQPTIPENPPPATKSMQKVMHLYFFMIMVIFLHLFS